MTPYRIPSPPREPTGTPWLARLRVLAFAIVGHVAILALVYFHQGTPPSGLFCILVFNSAMFASGMWGPWR